METIEVIESGARCRTTDHADCVGIICSFLCAVHCSVVPALVSVLPGLAGTHMPGRPIFHQIAAVICSVLVVLAIVPGYRTNRSQTMALLTVTGLISILAAAFILPNACCPQSQHTVVSSRIHGSEALTNVPCLCDLCCRSIDDSDIMICGLQRPDQVMSSGITTEHPPDTHGGKNSQLLLHAQTWLSPCGGMLLILAHGFNLRGRIRSHRCGCGY